MSATPTVYEAWSHVMEDVQTVAKTGRNEAQGFNFRGIDAVVNAVGPAIRKHGVLIFPGLIDSHYRDVEVGRNRTLMREVTVKVRYYVFGPAGDRLVVPDDPDFGVVSGESMDSGDKGTPKAMSVAYRIFLLQALTIPTSEPDPDSAAYERSARADDPEPAVGPGEMTAADGKKLLLASLGGDRDAATAAWTAARLDGLWRITDDQLAAAKAAATAEAGPSSSSPTPAAEGGEPEPAPHGPGSPTPGAYTQMKTEAEHIADEAPEVTP